MDIDALRSFLAFVETGSFTRAAKQVNRTQSALSAQMRKLEAEVGQGLFEKEGRNLVLSEAGTLRIGCPEDYNDSVLPVIMTELVRHAPTYAIQVINEPSVHLRKRLDEGDIDGAILTRHPNTDEGYWLMTDQGVWIASPDSKACLRSPLPLALFQTDCKYHGAAIDGLSKQGAAFQLVACCNTASAQRAIVRQGLAIGAMGRASVTDDLVILKNMPALPAMDVVFSVSASSHPILTPTLLQGLSGLFSEVQSFVEV